MSSKQYLIRLLVLAGGIGLSLANSGHLHRSPLALRAGRNRPGSPDAKWTGRIVTPGSPAKRLARPSPLLFNAFGIAQTPQAKMREATPKIEANSAQISIPVTFEPNVGDADASVQYVGRGKGVTILLARREIAVAVPRSSADAGAPNEFVRMRVMEIGARKRRSRPKTARSSHRTREHSRPRLRSRRKQTRPRTKRASWEDNRSAEFAWCGEEKLRGESNYFIGNNPHLWRTKVPHFAEAEAQNALPGVGVTIYGSDSGAEYDLRLAPGADPAKLRLALSGGDSRIASNGDLVLRVGASEMRMKKPRIYEEFVPPEPLPADGFKTTEKGQLKRESVDGGYVLEADGSLGFRVGPYNRHATLVIDPSISVTYATFLGGTGSETANSLALDGSGNVYIGGTTTVPAAFPESTTETLGSGIDPGEGTGGANGTSAEFFIAKVDPHVSGANSLVYLTFLGGSVDQAGALLAVDASGDVAITGTTSSPDFPVTNGSALTSGLNDTTVSEIDPTGTELLFSTLFGGNGAESQYGEGGIALDSADNIYVASDTSSTDLPVTTGAFQTTLTGRTADAFLAIFQPSSVPSLAYCSYLGTNANAQVGVGGITVDPSRSVYVAGFSSNAENSFPAKNAFQAAYGGDPTDAFLMKILPAGQGAADVIYATLLGGSGEDEALAVAVDNSVPPIAYVAGTTQSPNFPTNGTNAAFQPSLHANATANAFLAAVAQNPGTGMTYLAYSTYLGGSASDAARGVAVAAFNAVYVAGTTSSWDFPWRDNLQPFNGSGDAFVVKLDPTMAGSLSLVYATPLGGTAPPGVTVNATASAVAADRSGDVYVAGQVTAADFPTAISTAGVMSGFQPICASCQESPPARDAFLVALQESSDSEPSVYFNVSRVVFPAQPLGGQNAPQLVAVRNGGETSLNVSDVVLTGPNSQDFSLIGGAACQGQIIPPNGECSFEVNFVPSIAGPEGAVVSLTDNAPGNPQVLELAGAGEGPFASLSATALNFGSQPRNTVSLSQTITVTNTGNDTLSMGSPTETGTDVAQFFLSGKDITCGASLTPGQSCAVGVVFEPNAIGSFSAQINISDNSGGLASSVQVVTLAGIGTAPSPVASVTPGNLAFGEIELGSASGVQSVTLLNNGSTVLNVASIGITGANASDFRLAGSGSIPCPAGAGTVAIDASCTVNVQFAPQSGDTAGAKSATLTIADNAAGSPQTVAISGTATALPTIRISPESLSFPAQSVGIAGASQTVTLLNTSSAPLAIDRISMTGTNAADFIETNNCPPSLKAGANCSLNATFDPTPNAMTARSAAVTIADNAAGGPQTIPLSGAATQAAVSVSPANLNFGGQLAGTASPPETITVTNNGTGALAFSSIAVTGIDFTIGANTCRATSTPPGGTCTIQLAFSPACTNGSAARSAMLILNDNAPGSPQSVALTGTATGDFCFEPPATGSVSMTLTAGQTAAYSIVVNSPTGYKGTVSLSCSGAPTTSTCTVPSTITVPSQFSVTVPTVAGSTTWLIKGPTSGAPPAHRLFLAVAAFAMLAWIAAWAVGWRGRVSGACATGLAGAGRFVLAAVLLIVSAWGMAACSNSGNGANSNASPGTPSGTYALTVTGTDANTSAQIALSLTVN